jgi:inorganic pyrophosphatase
MNSIIGKAVTVTIDRQLGSRHPTCENICYSVNYGFVSGVTAADGDEQDAYVLGVDEPIDTFTGRVIAVIHRKDDVEDKWVVVPEDMFFTADEIAEQTYFQEQYFDSVIFTE